MKVLIGTTKNGINVFAGEDTYKHMEAHASVNMDHVSEAIGKTIYDGQFYIGTIDLEKIVGKDECVLLSEEDKKYRHWTPRAGRTINSSVVFSTDGFKPKDTSCITIGVCRDDDNLATLFTAFYGILAPKEPEDPRAGEDSKEFWENHAIVVEKEEI